MAVPFALLTEVREFIARPITPSQRIQASQAGHRVAFATAAQWVDRLAAAHYGDRLQDELIRLGRLPLLVIDEVGYIPFEPEAANLFFQLISARYERASLIVTSNKPFRHSAFDRANLRSHSRRGIAILSSRVNSLGMNWLS